MFHFIGDVETLLNLEISSYKPKLAADFSKELQLVNGLVVILRQRTQSLCRCCVAKLERFKKSKNSNDCQLKFPGDNGKFSVFLTLKSYIKEGECPICGSNVRKSPQKKRAHDSDSQYAKMKLLVSMQLELEVKKKAFQTTFQQFSSPKHVKLNFQ